MNFYNETEANDGEFTGVFRLRFCSIAGFLRLCKTNVCIKDEKPLKCNLFIINILCYKRNKCLKKVPKIFGLLLSMPLSLHPLRERNTTRKRKVLKKVFQKKSSKNLEVSKKRLIFALAFRNKQRRVAAKAVRFEL